MRRGDTRVAGTSIARRLATIRATSMSFRRWPPPSSAMVWIAAKFDLEVDLAKERETASEW
jgi:hypothetical protein